MPIIFAFLMGMTLGAAGLVAKHINAYPGQQLANKQMHAYLTKLGTLSGLVIPIIVTIIAGLSQGVAMGIGVLLALMIGAFCVGLFRLSLPTMQIATLFGFPFTVLCFVTSLGG